jgi:hypothetical protein
MPERIGFTVPWSNCRRYPGVPLPTGCPEGLMEQAPTGLMLYRSGVAIIIIRYGSPPKSAGLRGGPRGGT